MSRKRKTLITDMSNQQKISIDQLFPSPLNSFDVDDISDLVSSIRACGLLTPLTVAGPGPDGRYEILSGERRYRSIRQINTETPGFMDEIPCYVVGSSNMGELHKKLAIELSNLEARVNYDRDAHRFNVIHIYRELADQGDIEEREIVKLVEQSMKLSPRYSTMYMTIFRSGIPDLRRAVESTGKTTENEPAHIPVSIAAQIAPLPPEQQKIIIDRVNDGEKPTEVLNEVLGRKNPANIHAVPAASVIPVPSAAPAIGTVPAVSTAPVIPVPSAAPAIGTTPAVSTAPVIPAPSVAPAVSTAPVNPVPSAAPAIGTVPAVSTAPVIPVPSAAPAIGTTPAVSAAPVIPAPSVAPAVSTAPVNPAPSAAPAIGTTPAVSATPAAPAQQQEKEKKTHRSPMSPEDALIRDLIENGEDLDLSSIDVVGFMERNSDSFDLSIDTTGLIGKYGKDAEEEGVSKEDRNAVHRWINKMSRAIQQGEVAPEDQDLFEELTILLADYSEMA